MRVTLRIIFNITPVLGGPAFEKARFGNTAGKVGFFRVGDNPNDLDPFRRLEVVDAADQPQFRITQLQGFNGKYTDFQTTPDGDLTINPSHEQVGINLGTGEPDEALDVDGNGRFRQVPNNGPNDLLVTGKFVGSGGTEGNGLRSMYMFIYTLVVDGKEAGTKRMILTE